MNKWPMVELADLCDTTSKTLAPKQEEVYDHYSIPAFDESLSPVREYGSSIQSNKIVLEKPCLLYSRLNPRIKRIWQLDELSPSNQSICSTEFVPFIIKDDNKLFPRYLYYFLGTDRFLTFARAGVKAATKSRERVKKEILFTVQIPLPPLAEQKRIAAILDKAEHLQQLRQKQLAKFDELIQAVFLDMFGEHQPDYDSWPPIKVEDAVAGKKAMRTGPFGSALKHSEFVDTGIAVLGIDNAVDNEFKWKERRYITKEKYEGLKRYRVYPGDVIITIMGTTGRSAIVPEDIPESISTKHLAVITLDKEKMLSEFLLTAFQFDPKIRKQIKEANKGAIMDGLNLGIIRSLNLRLPPLANQLAFRERYLYLTSLKRGLSVAVYAKATAALNRGLL